MTGRPVVCACWAMPAAIRRPGPQGWHLLALVGPCAPFACDPARWYGPGVCRRFGPPWRPRMWPVGVWSVSPANFWNEAQALAAGLAPGWTFDRGELSTLHRKTAAYVRGEMVEWEGRKVPGLYTPRNATLLERFKITPEEERQLRTIVSKGEARRRDAERKREKRRQAGAVDRATYEASAQHRREVARALRAEGLKQREIAERLGVTERAVRGYLK